MAKLLVLGNAHGGSNAVQYTRAFRELGHQVTFVGPRFTGDDAQRWRRGLLQMAWPASEREADEYVARVLAESLEPDVVTGPGAVYEAPTDADALVVFDAYGETPRPFVVRSGVPSAVVFGDTHTGHLARHLEEAAAYDHVSVQFRRGDMASFWQAGHHSVHWLPPAADPAIWTPEPVGGRDVDVLFVGATDPSVHRERVHLLAWLQDELGPERVQVKHAFGADAASLVRRAKVVLNRSLAGDTNMRLMEALSCGAALVTDMVDGLAELGIVSEAGEAACCYRNPKECLSLVRQLLDDERERRSLGEAGRRLVLARQTYVHRGRQVLRLLGLEETHGSGPAARADADTGVVRGRAPALGALSDGERVAAGLAGGDAGGSVGAEAALLGVRDRGVGAASLPSRAPRVSIVIPAYNHWQDATAPLLSRLEGQLPKDGSVEVILVDDGSTDETTEALRYVDYQEWLTALHQPNGGFAAAVNAGAAMARGEVLVVLNNDTEPEEGGLGRLVDALVANADATTLVGSLLLHPDGTVQAAGLRQCADGTWLKKAGTGWAEPEQWGIAEQDAVMGACFALRRADYFKLGGLDEGYRNGCEDVDLCLRVRAAGGSVLLAANSRVIHHEGTTRFARAEFQAEVQHNQARLLERWPAPAREERGHEAIGAQEGRRGAAPPAGCPGAIPHRTAGTRLDDSPPGGPHEETDDGTVVGDPAGGAGGCAAGAGRGGSVPGGGEQGPVPRLSLGLLGPTDVETGGSLAVINRALVGYLPARGVTVRVGDVGDVTLLHYWPGPEAHTIPDGVRRLAVIAPWEAGPPPPAWAQTWANPGFRLLLTPSRYSEALFLAAFPELAGRTRVIPNGFDPAVFAPDGPKAPVKDQGRWRVLFVGGLLERKGVRELYGAWRLAFRPDEPVGLILKAQGRQTFYRTAWCPPPADLPNVRVVERYMEPPELASLYRRSDVVCQPYRHEGFGLPLLEAMACGRPVIWPAHGPALEFVPEAAGLDVPVVGSHVAVEALARALRFLYEHRGLGEEMGAAALEWTPDYAWPKIAVRYAAALQEVANGD